MMMDINRQMLSEAREVDPKVKRVTISLGASQGSMSLQDIVSRMEWDTGKTTQRVVGRLELPCSVVEIAYRMAAGAVRGVCEQAALGPDVVQERRPENEAPSHEESIAGRLAWWLGHGEIGISSRTIAACLSGAEVNPPAGAGSWFHASPPMDVDDVRRCELLLDLIPEWRPRLKEVAARFPEWKELVENWPPFGYKKDGR